MLNAIADLREEARGLAEVKVLRVEIDALVSQVLGERAMTGLDSVKIQAVQRGQESCIPREANMRTSS